MLLVFLELNACQYLLIFAFGDVYFLFFVKNQSQLNHSSPLLSLFLTGGQIKLIFFIKSPTFVKNKEMKISDILTIDPNVQFGTPVFKGTRVPSAFLLEFLEDGFSIEQFIEEFPSVRYQQAVDLLEWTKFQ
jgi:uncharacterized protein (DUF433 family)